MCALCWTGWARNRPCSQRWPLGKPWYCGGVSSWSSIASSMASSMASAVRCVPSISINFIFFHVNCCSAKVSRRAILWEMFGYFKAAQPAARWGETVLTLPHPGMNGHSVPPGPTAKRQQGQREKVPVWVFDHKAPPPKACTDSDHESPWNLKLIRIWVPLAETTHFEMVEPHCTHQT